MSVPTSADDRILEARLLHVEDLALELNRLRPAVAALGQGLDGDVAL